MRLLIRILILIRRISTSFPRTVILAFGVLAAVGFYLFPSITISTDLIAGVGDTNEVINLTRQNNELFGEQDSLIIVLEFPEPPGVARRPFIEGLGDKIGRMPDVRRVLYRFLDPEDEKQTARLFRHFLLGMNQRERESIREIFSPGGVFDALRRNRNRLFLTQDPDLQRRIMADPLELGQFVAGSFNKRVGNVSFGDPFLFLASPDNSMFLIQVTPDFPSSNIAKGKEFLLNMEKEIPKFIETLMSSIPGAREQFEGLQWRLTGKTVFHYESDRMFDEEMLTILVLSLSMVSLFLVYAYRSLRAVGILMVPIGMAVGATYFVVYLTYKEINPVVMASAGILFGLGTDFGVHLWGRFGQEIKRLPSVNQALDEVLRTSGPPVSLGALTSVIAFICLRISDQPAMGQFGYVCAAGVMLALVITLFLFPAIATLVSRRPAPYYPTLRARFPRFAVLFEKAPRLIAYSLPIAILLSVVASAHLSREQDLIKAFMARGIESVAVADRISSKFQSNFSQPTFLSFDVKNPDDGVRLQRELDAILEGLMEKRGEIATLDSISYLTAPESVKKRNKKAIAEIASRLPYLEKVLIVRLDSSDFSSSARKQMVTAFRKTANLLRDIDNSDIDAAPDGPTRTERSWYRAKVDGKTRFLTKIRYADTVDDPDALKRADRVMMEKVKALPVKVSISGPRQSMEAILDSLITELLKLGIVAALCVVAFLLAVFRNLRGVILSLIPMTGAFCITLGLMGIFDVGIPFSIIGVAPLIFGLGIDSGIHIVMRSLEDGTIPLSVVMDHMTPMVTVTSLTTMLGFLSMVISKHYAMEFLGWAMVMGMGASLLLTIVALPACLLLLRRRKQARAYVE